MSLANTLLSQLATPDPDQPWLTEPREVRWTDPVTALRCWVRRHPVTLALCGYVQVPPDNPLHGVHYSNLDTIVVHGGLTFSGRIEGHFYLGFDCSHAWDLLPGLPWQNEGAFYRTVEFVKTECTRLAAQVHALRTGYVRVQ